MTTLIKGNAGRQRGQSKAMVKRSSGQIFTTSGRSGNSGGGVFVTYDLPKGGKAHVLDRRVYEKALEKTDSQVRRTLDAIRKHRGEAGAK